MNSIIVKHLRFANNCIRSLKVVNLTQHNRYLWTASRPSHSLRFFSTGGQQQLNENEVIELVEGKIFEVLKSAAKCNHSKLSRTATFDELGFDSLDGVELVLAMEEHFGFDLTNQEAEKITSVMDAIQIFHTNFTKRLQPATTDAQG
jgi:acyl carrier protein